MADSVASPEKTEPNSQQPGPDNPTLQPNQPDTSPPPPSSSSSTPPVTIPPNPSPNPTTPPPPFISPLPPPAIQPYLPPQLSTVPPSAPSFRPAAPPVPVPTAPQFSPLPNSNFQAQSFQNLGVQPPGVSPVPVMMPPAASVVGSVAVSARPPMVLSYAPPGQPPNPALRPYAPMPNGYPAMPSPAPQGTIPPPGILRYPSPYATMVRSAFPPRLPGLVGIIPVLSRPPVPGIRGPIIPPVVRPAVIPSVTPTEKPQTTVYVGKIASTVENDFMLSLLQLCGPVKSWKRAQDPTNGALKGFGFCEFDSAEGVLRALRLLSKFNIDGQELMLNVNQATREYLERYVEKKRENSKDLKAIETEGADKEASASGAEKEGAEKDEPPKPSVEDSKEDNKDMANKDNHDLANFGLVTDEDGEADQEALEKLTSMIEERLKTKPLPPPPPPPQTATDGSGNSNLEHPPARSRDGDSDVDIMRSDAAEDRNEDEMTSESKPPSEPDRRETSSPDRSRRNDRRSRDRNRDRDRELERERDMKWEKERELERYEREREQERAKKERDRKYKIREDERRYMVRLKEWESREREREHSRKLEKEREKEREQERKWEIMDQERDSDDGYTKKRKYKSSGEERKRMLREKEEDLADRLEEEEEIAKAKRKAEAEQQQQKQQEKDALKLLSVHETSQSDQAVLPDETNVESKDKAADQTSDGDSERGNHIGEGVLQNGTGDESTMESIATSDMRQSSNAPTKKLGFGLVGSGKRTSVPSVFHEEEDEDAQKEKKMRTLVPIDYSAEELQAVRHNNSGVPSPNLVAAAEFAKHISHVNSKEDRPDAERERSRRHHERSSQKDRDRNDEANRTKDERRGSVDRDKDRDRGLDKVKTPDNKKLLDAKQLIDTIPKTKDELFSYKMNWAIYDKNELHERMRPWISKKITEFLGEEETTLVDYIVSSTREHVKASEMLERLQTILDDEAEMFVLKMWRMLIFEIKRVETGLALRSKT